MDTETEPRTCILTGAEGENPDDCTTHDHEETFPPVDTGLYVDAIDTKPMDYDWSEGYDPDGSFMDLEGGAWTFYESDQCQACEQYTDGHGFCQTEGCEHYGDRLDSIEGPMMSYYYPCELQDPAEAAVVLGAASLPVCVVNVDGTTGLALTGGGMDLSWEICEAFLRVGYLPPLHFCDLPQMGRGDSPRDRWIIAGCKRTAEVASGWAVRTAERLAEQYPTDQGDALRYMSAQAWRRLRQSLTEGELRDLARDVANESGGDAGRIARALTATDWEGRKQG